MTGSLTVCWSRTARSTCVIIVLHHQGYSCNCSKDVLRIIWSGVKEMTLEMYSLVLCRNVWQPDTKPCEP